MIGIINYGLGNLGSLINMCNKIGYKASIVDSPVSILSASHLILPGVGSFDSGMKNLHSMGLIPILNTAVLESGIPILGVCLGAQLMLESSEEGEIPGLGWIRGRAVRFKATENLKVPHMGWNTLSNMENCNLFKNMPKYPPRFYFVHSYYFKLVNREDLSSESHYGIPFCASFQRGNVMGVQFHPEKSHLFGMTLLQNFLTSA